MRKVHCRIVLDVFVYADDDADVEDYLADCDNISINDTDNMDIQNIYIESIEVTDSR